MTHIWTNVTTALLAFTGLVLMFIILLQRGRGGGLAGAFGAMGGQSAFGTKAGDVFTRITIGVAVVWVALAALAGYAMRAENTGRFTAANSDTPALEQSGSAKGAGKADDDAFQDEDKDAKPPERGSSASPPAKEGAPAKPSSGAPAKNETAPKGAKPAELATPASKPAAPAGQSPSKAPAKSPATETPKKPAN